MAEYIEREALIKLCELKHYVVSSNESPFDAVRKQGRFFREAVDEAPAVDVVPRSKIAEIFEEIEGAVRSAISVANNEKSEVRRRAKEECYKGFICYLGMLKREYTEGE